MYIWVEGERELEMTEMHTHKGDGVVLLWNLSAFLLRFSRVEIFPGRKFPGFM